MSGHESDLDGTLAALFGQDAKDKKKGDAVVDDRPDEPVDRPPFDPPRGSVQRQYGGGIGKQRAHEWHHARRVEWDVCEQARPTSTV